MSATHTQMYVKLAANRSSLALYKDPEEMSLANVSFAQILDAELITASAQEKPILRIKFFTSSGERTGC